MSVVLARTGRHRQRYDDHFRLVSGCIPYRLIEDSDEVNEQCNIENKIEVLMVSSPNRDDLVFPKGGWEDDETILEAACREAVEEAGVRGKLNENPLGVWEFRSKSNQDICSMEGACRGYMFALEVTEELESWPEQGNRHRIWLNVKEAFRLCRYEWMRMALEVFLRVLAGDENGETRQETASTAAAAETSPVTVSNVVDCALISSNCCGRPPPFSQQHGSRSHSAGIEGISRGCRLGITLTE
ncbi:nudix hydrolase 13, mitochondrial-like [Cucurbita maxima]|uniref:Nudix hydrolase 13, mitochondrial-like n=1 Tax=Cucurbita maxima TaxID=3661 RepID=A0A6J1J574_CUCMA|nr:nudix hydrolase 13, mitochondrial-like [Cucurbita maxima]